MPLTPSSPCRDLLPAGEKIFEERPVSPHHKTEMPCRRLGIFSPPGRRWRQPDEGGEAPKLFALCTVRFRWNQTASLHDYEESRFFQDSDGVFSRAVMAANNLSLS
ncbi:hypothetical protein FB480_103119 [Agrobacterium vitis]|nr:hypothetical protein FB480_103119 [Agrobacterium vitis]